MIVCVDMDHTMTDAHWRDGLIPAAMDSGNWDDYHAASVKDKPVTPILKLVIALHNAGHDIWVVTARPKRWLEHTLTWLRDNGIFIAREHILMREADNFMSSPELKMELIEAAGLKVDLFIEDREDVCVSMAAAGITTMQVRIVS